MGDQLYMRHKRRLLAALPAVALMATITAVGATAPQAARASGGVEVLVGYADTLRANPVNFPTPWEGSPNVIYQGCSPSTGPGKCDFDAGAVMFVNNTTMPVSITGISVSVDTCTYHGWAGTPSLPPNGELIITQMTTPGPGTCTAPSPDHFDTSDIGKNSTSNSGNCTQPDGITPTISATIGGSAATFNDTARVLNTGGVDPGSCGNNESQQWAAVGTICSPGATLTLAPPSQTHSIGATATVTATLMNGCHQPLQGAVVNFSALPGSPNASPPPPCPPATTNSSGQATCSYTSTKVGTDTLQASTSNPAGTISSNPVTVTWIGAFLARGSFVIADTSAATGTHVTFWGARWAKINVPSGGPAPRSFKGFAANLQTTPPACGQTWTSLPGNSSKPPAGPLPKFMAIIVASSLTKHGHTISGNIVEIVTVKVGPGYAPNPGHAGTGVVVSKIC
jgi:hypothetical protein